MKKIGVIIQCWTNFNFVWQQYKVIKNSTTLEVEEYYGAKGVDEWTRSCWETEANTHDVSLIFFDFQVIDA